MTPEFRVWDKNKKMIVEGIVICDGEIYEDWRDFEDGIPLVNLNYCEQYTGLKDKDGNKIFEGDIVHISLELNSEISGYAEVVFESGSFAIKGEIMKQIIFDGILYDSYSEWDDRLSLYDGACVVVGNVHENLELMEVEK